MSMVIQITDLVQTNPVQNYDANFNTQITYIGRHHVNYKLLKVL